jgi:hypothetical protein
MPKRRATRRRKYAARRYRGFLTGIFNVEEKSTANENLRNFYNQLDMAFRFGLFR